MSKKIINLTKKETIKIFEERKVRTVWDENQEKWYFSIIDAVAILTDSKDSTAYWRKLKQRLKTEGNETVTNCHGFKLRAADGKMRKTDVSDTEQLFRLIQSIPSPKAEPFKQWMAQVASTRIDQMQDPELSIDQAVADSKLCFFKSLIMRSATILLVVYQINNVSSFCIFSINYKLRLSLFIRKSSKPTVNIPCWSLFGLISSFTTMIFLKESLINENDVFSCCSFSILAIANADWI